MNSLLLTRDTLNVSDICNIVSNDSCGAISLFVGTTRGNFDEKKVLYLEYEAYESMAYKQLEVICEELRRQWPDIENIAIYHRLGYVPVRESSVVIAISSPHRQTSLEAVSSAIKELKKRVPIWKKEYYQGDEHSWKENKEFGDVGSSKSILFGKSMCDTIEPHLLPKELIQISACEDEIKRRIQCFVEGKRAEINLSNIMDFADIQGTHVGITQSDIETEQNQKNLENGEIETCARVNSTIVKQEYSNCHLRVRRAENCIGPQIKPLYLNALDKLMSFQKIADSETNFLNRFNHNMVYSDKRATTSVIYPAISKRLEDIEQHIKIPIMPTNIYQRLKNIEDRILYLESISPEYRHFLVSKSDFGDGNCFPKPNNYTKQMPAVSHKRIYSANEMDSIIQKFEGRNRE